MKTNRIAALAALITSTAFFCAGAQAQTVQLDPTGTGNYTITDIAQFDWQASGNLLIADTLTTTASYTGGTTNSFNTWATNASIGDSVSFNLFYQTRLNDINGTAGAIDVPTLSNDGLTCFAGAGCFEITVAFSGTETATLTSAGQLTFTGITGEFGVFLSAPNSDVAAGTGFDDGAQILFGNLSCTTVGDCGKFSFTGGGESFLTATFTSTGVDTNYITGMNFLRLLGATLDTTVEFLPPLADALADGSSIGLTGSTLGRQVANIPPDLLLQADSSSVFRVPEPGTLMLAGAALLVLAGTRRRVA